MKLRNTILAASLLALPTAALAQPVNGVYVGAGAGLDWMSPQTLNKDSSAPKLDSGDNPGPIGVVSGGYGFGNGLRVELQGGYWNADENRNVPYAYNQTYAIFANVLYDFDIGSKFVYPYIGVGAGAAMQDLTKGRTGTGAGFSGTDTTFGVQGIIGAAFPVQSVPGLSATLEYRYIELPETMSYKGTNVGSQINSALLFGLRYAFNVAPPPPPPAPAPTPVAAPAPAPSRTYLVFFDWDKADLTERAKQIIAEAAQNVGRVQVTRIEVNGYTDTSGAKAYNQKLSEQRANNVAAELVRDGVPQNEIVTQGFGDTKLLVPTAASVREPQNRRVEIILK